MSQGPQHLLVKRRLQQKLGIGHGVPGEAQQNSRLGEGSAPPQNRTLETDYLVFLLSPLQSHLYQIASRTNYIIFH